MITLESEDKCCGCGACVQRCPNSCIVLEEDPHGFLYPTVDLDQCVDCHLCEQVCPFLNKSEIQYPIDCFASANNDQEIRRESSSGGLFSLLAQNVIASGGVVFGAKFDGDWNVVHDFADNLADLAAFRSSKYVQSAIRDSYIKAEEFLKQDKTVLFCGTPCQIAGLNRYLGREYEKLITAEVVCHGVPSPKVWREYLHGITKNTRVSEVCFRDKSTGWREYSVRIGKSTKRHDYDHYMGCFLGNYSLRQSCFNCPAKSGHSGADIIMGDLWGSSVLAPSLNDNKGTSLVIVNTEKGMDFVKRSDVPQLMSVQYEQAVKHNPAICNNPVKPADYEEFWRKFSHHPLRSIMDYGKRHFPSRVVRIKQCLYRMIKG